jgi:hypothetical protein
VNTLVDDEEPEADRHTAARPTPPVEVETMAKTATPKPVITIKHPEPAAETPAPKTRVRKSRAKPKAEPVTVTVTVPPVAAAPAPVEAVPTPPPGYVPPAERAPTLGFAEVYSALVQRRVSIISTTITVCVVLAVTGLVMAVAGPIVALCAAVIAFFFGLGIQKAVKTGLNKYLSVGLMRKAVGFVFGVAVAGMSLALGLVVVALPVMLFLIAAVGLHSLLLEYRVAQIGVGEVQVLESIAPEAVGVGGFDAPSVPAASRMPTDGDAA